METSFVQVGAEHEEALELLLLADQGRLDPRAVGRRQCPGRHDDDLNGDDQLIATPGGYIPPGLDIVLAGPQRVARDTAGCRRRRDLVPQPL